MIIINEVKSKEKSELLFQITDSSLDISYHLRLGEDKKLESLILESNYEDQEYLEIEIPEFKANVSENNDNIDVELFARSISNTCISMKEEIVKDIDALRLQCGASDTPWLISVGKLEPAEMIAVDGKGYILPFQIFNSIGPWNVEIIVKGQGYYDHLIKLKLRIPGLLGPDYEMFGRNLPICNLNPLRFSYYPFGTSDIQLLTTIIHCNENDGKPSGLYHYNLDEQIEESMHLHPEQFKYELPEFRLYPMLQLLCTQWLSSTPIRGIDVLTQGQGANATNEAKQRWKHAGMHNYQQQLQMNEYIHKYAIHKYLFDHSNINFIARQLVQPSLLSLMDSNDFNNSTINIHNHCNNNNEFYDIVRKESANIYSIPLLTKEGCNHLLQEYENFLAIADKHNWDIRRPNSMNAYGVILHYMGLEPFILALQKIILKPLAKILFPVIGNEIDSHHSFLVDYSSDDGKDKLLDMHHDHSDVTFNTCLGYEGFVGSGLTFCGVVGTKNHRQMQTQYQHDLGRCIIHKGSQRHGADKIIEGRRVNFIMWNRSSLYHKCSRVVLDANVMVRDGRYEIEQGEVSPLCYSVTHDRDHPDNIGKNKGWCPPYKSEW